LAGVLSRTAAGPTKVSALPFYLDAVITATTGLKHERRSARRMVFGQPGQGFLDHIPCALARPVAAAGQDGDQGLSELLGGLLPEVHASFPVLRHTPPSQRARPGSCQAQPQGADPFRFRRIVNFAELARSPLAAA
jgi:hypothetical protein